MEIKVKISTTEIEKRIFDAAADVQSSVVRNSLNVFFNAGCAFGKQWGGVEGAGHLLIREAVEQKLNELHSIQAGIARMAPEIQQLVVMAKLLPDERRALGRIQSGLEDVRSRLNSIERSVAYASSYAAIRLKERSDAQG